MRRPLRTAFVIALHVVLLSARAKAIHWQIYTRWCWIEPIEILEIPEIPVPVGCEVIDCCPGCPGPGPIEWRINVDRNLTKAVTLRFEGLDRAALTRLKVGGAARREGNQIIVGAGESTISGLPFSRSGRVAVANVRVTIDKARLGAMKPNADADAAKAAAAANESDAGFQIVQYLGSFIINRFDFKYPLVYCGPLIVIEDRIRVQNNTSTDNTVILADYRTGAGCQDDLIHRTSTTVGIGNALTNAACNSEVSVFSDDNAMSFEPTVTTWTDPMGDLHTVNLQPIIVAPVSIWIANGAAAANAANDMANANLLYNQNNTGVQFNPTFNNVSGNPNAVATIDGTLGDCASAANMNTTPWYTANRLNIYYVNGAFTGVNCGADRNVSFIGTIANIASLPHEIGHAYGLRPSGSGGHTNGLAGFGNNNIMWGGGPATRNNFSVGQAFRLNVYNISMLNVNGNRTGPTRNCPPLTTSTTCPALALDSLPH
jgi:hypothetical protein